MSSTPTHRIFNFSAGPAVLPEPVLEEAQRDLMALPGVGMSVLEISHRSAAFDRILGQAEADLRALTGAGDEYHVLFLQGGASQQFAMVPMNLLPPDGVADYSLTGSWAKKAAAEAAKFGRVNICATTEEEAFTRVPAFDGLQVSDGSAYVHVTSNNTIVGTQWPSMPDVGDTPLVVDASSDLLCRPIDMTRYGLIYGGAQKNLGPAGLTLVIIRADLAERGPESLPTMLRYAVAAKNRSRYNTPPVFAIYLFGLVMRWLLDNGGLAAMETRNRRKAALLYEAIDRTGFYRGTAQTGSRSLMNVTFRLSSEELERRFVTEAGEAGFSGLKGHRSVGGQRASIYNAFPESGVEALVAFMAEFERVHG
ncbi:MAG: 3-phosphoserine/phosphohydroxythreonine aminotransferase [Acidobacteria bacterium]|jgi:phosphoserine aminotransferase|nr:3-phosphoserine/phosphohydroxythreonine aminotransferase [Acidobacteriota bacterium]MDP7338564.1 3-phosphoserine/phosphohydroxythreonine transaminase [Vicinamibacterales bacterium]MDP7478361.1 3-phosphoserine/phosphohydroxythreonine transaminase [Vicinamibacterales bacterium]HJN42925.1 3-phosphoserine/phosphohydroxythreonine transaminase [Vicinamibacterales bacterium]|tara:strand:+ start:737 stop:1834 length:1098 start_codon:yes stop_codon:yes gene_type:complete